jgi:hypothetical protein
VTEILYLHNFERPVRICSFLCQLAHIHTSNYFEELFLSVVNNFLQICPGRNWCIFRLGLHYLIGFIFRIASLLFWIQTFFQMEVRLIWISVFQLGTGYIIEADKPREIITYEVVYHPTLPHIQIQSHTSEKKKSSRHEA